MSILVVSLDPMIERTLTFDTVTLNEVNRAGHVRSDPSGSGANCARVLQQFGAPVRHLSSCRGDAEGCREEIGFGSADGSGRGDAPFEPRQAETFPAGIAPAECTTVVSKATGGSSQFVAAIDRPGPELEEQLLTRYEELLREVRFVIIAGIDLLDYRESFLERVVRTARDAAVPILVQVNNPEKHRYLRGQDEGGTGPDYVVLSDSARRLVQIGDGSGAALQWMRGLVSRGITPVICRGESATWSLPAAEAPAMLEVEPIPVMPVNTRGCIDAFIAGFSLELYEGGGLREAMERGHAAAAMNAVQLQPGTICPD